MKTKLHYAGFDPLASGFGWATCNKQLRAALADHFTITDDDPEIVFMPLADHDFNPVAKERGRINFAYTFFEYPLGPNAARNAAKYDVVFCGSTWCLERMQDVGITNGRVLIQGVDYDTFKHGVRKYDGKTRIFSGGKFEHRKGQDLVLYAFREFLKTHPEAHLVCSWHNPWPELKNYLLDTLQAAICRNPNIAHHANKWIEDRFLLMMSTILPGGTYTLLPKLNQRDLAREMANTDFGVFPNRCEGGTNLVLMEYMAIGRPAAANILTGHRDVFEAGANIAPIEAREGPDHWAEQTVEDIVAAMEECYKNYRIDDDPVRFTWEDAAKTVAQVARRITG